MRAFLAALALACACFPGLASAQSALIIREFFNTFTGHYFMTGSVDEAAGIESGAAGPGWKSTGYQFFASGGKPVCRFYAPPPTNSHFYTADPAECEFLKTHDTGWRYEAIAFFAEVPSNGSCAPGLSPVYRMYNNRAAALDSNHRFNPDDRVVARMKAQGWIVEGVAFCSRFVERETFVFDVFGSPFLPPSPFCTTVTGTERCIALAASAEMKETLSSASAGYTPAYAAKTGWIANVDMVYSAFAGVPAEHSFVQFAFGGQVIGVHLVGSDRQFGNGAVIAPTIRTRDPRGGPLVPWPDNDVHDVIANFQLRIATVVRPDDFAQAFGGPVFDFTDRKSGQHLLVRALAYSSGAGGDFTGIDAITGNTMVSTTFAAPRFGRVLKGQFIACAFARRETGGCPAPGIDYSYRIDQDDFANIVAMARSVNGALSPNIADYVLLGLQLRNETVGDAELGLLENAVQLVATK